MDLRVRGELGRRGLVLRRFCLANGMSGVEVDGLVRSGRWIAVRRGVYAEAGAWSALDEYVGQPLLRSRAASLAMFTPHVLSHDSAALAWGLTVLQGHRQPAHVTRFGVLGSRHEHGVKHHKAPFTADQVSEIDGYLLLDRARTVADISRDRGRDAGLVTADSAMRAGVTRAELLAATEAMACWPHVTVSREVADLADPGAENAAETLARSLVTELGRGRPVTQSGLSDGGRTVWTDLRVGRHVFEFDGRIKYRTVADGGHAATSPEEVAWAEKRRRDFIQSFRLGVSRIVWTDLWGTGRRAAVVRLAREVEATERLFGMDTADLAPYLRVRPELRDAS